MGLQTDYEKAKAEAWDKFRETELKDRPQWEPISNKKVFDYAFEAAYRYGVWCGVKKRSILNADGNPDHIPGATKKVDRAMIAAMAMQGIITSEIYLHTLDNKVQEEGGGEGRLSKLVAVEARYFADALIEELGKEKG